MTNQTQAPLSQDTYQIPKTYDPQQIEGKWYPIWEDNGYFQPSVSGNPYCIVIPPPNVTGYLHMGHALQHALMDTLVRWQRMCGKKALWLPGTDHAGIATQMVVEKQLNSQGLKRTDLDRETFEKKVWEWREHSGGTIQKQMRLEGISVDWSRERFTLDEGLSTTVKEVFVRLYEQGLIYRGSYMVNWSPKLNTAISDLEVEMKEVKGKLYHIRYQIVDSSEYVTVATTRPETMLGDTAIAIHPEDERYKALHGKQVILPIIGRHIPIITDDVVEIEFGTGVVKVTPAHDPNDFEMGKRHGLEFITVIGKTGQMTESTGEFQGLDRYEARERLIQLLEEQGVLEKVENYVHKVGHCQRSGVPIEPLISDQWFLNVKEMAQAAIQAVKDERIKFVPDHWEKVFFDWMENIRPWCISRQLWWGHRIPAWYTPDGQLVVARSEMEARNKVGDANIQLRQDEDVLDTWFSSGLWPFSTLGWPQITEDLKTFYPTTILVTGFDIIFFWVARMVMFGLHFMNDVPFKTVFITGLVRDAQGQKMSKTKGNVVDPLDVFVKYGTDAVRFTLISAVTGGNDIKLQENKMEASRNFVNKIWNAVRFVLINIGDVNLEPDWKKIEGTASLADRWIISKLNRTILDVNNALQNLRFHEGAQILYHFFWDDFCDWYIEFSKPAVTSQTKSACQRTGFILEQAMRLLHPFMPFITEELWQKLTNGNVGASICISKYPTGDESLIDTKSITQMQIIIEIITKIRNIRCETNIPPSVLFKLHTVTTNTDLATLIREQEESIKRLARVEIIQIDEKLPDIGFAAKAVVSEIELAIPLTGIIDPKQEKARLFKEIFKNESELEKVATQLNAPGFLDRAPQNKVEEVKARHNELEQQIVSLKSVLSMIN